ncbi:MAG: hypothetical protein HY877_00705 [Deltaproteobacteria bacterium]|nr:hypothetical protein [Deltaproteobacteria bacterium]
MKTKIVTGFIFVLFMLLQGCKWSVPKDPHVLVQTLGTDPETLNPVIATTSGAFTVYGFIYEQLIDLDPDTLKPVPRLATRWEVSPDRLYYTFYLRNDIRWHDGKPFTADDVLYTYQKIMDPKVDAAASRNYLQDIIKAEKVDDYTVRFTYRRPYIGALTAIGLMVIVPKHVFDDGQDFNSHPANRAPVGTGPFQFVEWRTGNQIVLKKFEGYNTTKPYSIQKMVFKIIPDTLTSFQLFKKNELDFINLTTLQWARQTDSAAFLKRFVKHKFITPFDPYNYIGWNLRRPVFQDKRVRLALAHLIDKALLNQKLLFGLAYPITGPYYPFGNNYDKTLPPISYDIEEAKRLLKAAGWDEKKPLHFTLLFPGGGQFAEQLVSILRENFSRAGVKLELRRLDIATLFRLVEEHDFDAYLGAWGRGANDEDLYQIWHSSQIKEGSNYIGYSNPEADRLLEDQRREFNEVKRNQINQQIHKILYEDQPYLFLYAFPELVARDKRFKNVKEHLVGLDMREWMVE